MIEQALPLWASRGFDPEHERFEESLTLQGEPVRDVPHRLIVQGRQVHSYVLARQRGWFAAADDQIERGFHAMVRDYRKPHGWIYSAHRNGETHDGRRDLYAQAFLLLAAGSYAGLTGDRAPLA